MSNGRSSIEIRPQLTPYFATLSVLVNQFVLMSAINLIDAELVCERAGAISSGGKLSGWSVVRMLLCFDAAFWAPRVPFPR